MTLRLVATLGALCVLCSACPPAVAPADAGSVDGGDGGTLAGGCTGGCGPNQICDLKRHICVDPCGGCAAGSCVKSDAGQYQCEVPVTACSGAVCATGQVACVFGGCSCLPFTSASEDSCAAAGRICHAAYNGATHLGGSCDGPRRYEQCKTKECEGGLCAPCPSGQTCTSGLFGDTSICAKQCPNGTSDCDRDERCEMQGHVCYPKSVFIAPDCERVTPWDGGAAGDGGPARVAVGPGERCTALAEDGSPTEPAPTGNCSYSLFQLASQLFPIANCRPPGTAGLNETCRRDFSATTVATQCGSGLECVVGRGNEGLCRPLCNAAAANGRDVCGPDEACVNFYRRTTGAAAVGACLKRCDVFAADGGASCAAYGATVSSCVPVPSSGLQPVSLDGVGLCLPQRAVVSGAGQGCAEVDSFLGASCASGLICSAGERAPACERPCDLGCEASPAAARCASEANARCPEGKHCAVITSGASLGFCR